MIPRQELWPQNRRGTRLGLMLLLAGGFLACGGPGSGGGGNSGSNTQGNTAIETGGGTLSAPVAADLALLREEEKLARDVYLTLGAQWDVPIFSNIAESEGRHMAQVGALLDAYDLPDPVRDDSIGVFTNPDLGALYENLVADGGGSAAAAFAVGAEIEELDIADIQRMESHAPPAAVADVYASLRCGSGNHLRAFASQLERAGETFAPQHISETQAAALLSADQEMCGL